MSRKSVPAKTYCTLREAFDLVGAKVYGPKWQGFEADCDPARAAQPTDAKTLLREPAPDGQSFTDERLPVPPRPIDGKDGAKLKLAIERHVEAIKELLHFLHGGFLPYKFIPEDGTPAGDAINASDWPDPAKFDPREPTWSILWFNIATDRVVRKPLGTSPLPGRVQSSLWWAYGEGAGRVEIDRGALTKLLRSPHAPAEIPVPEVPEDEPKTFRDRAVGWLEAMESLRETQKISWRDAATQIAGSAGVDHTTVEREARRIRQDRDKTGEKSGENN